MAPAKWHKHKFRIALHLQVLVWDNTDLYEWPGTPTLGSTLIQKALPWSEARLTPVTTAAFAGTGRVLGESRFCRDP